MSSLFNPEITQSTTDLPVPSVEPSAKQQDPVMSVPAAEKQPDAPKPKPGGFNRQLVLMKEIQQFQVECEYDPGHRLQLLNKDTITCYHCGALWIK